MSGWLIQVAPLDDTRTHVADSTCWCDPNIQDDVLVHNSADNREKYERGERKPS